MFGFAESPLRKGATIISLATLVLLGVSLGASSADGADVYTVDKIYDDGSPGTFRWALLESERDAGASLIEFSGIEKVWLDPFRGPLPIIRQGDLTIDGRSSPTWRVTVEFRADVGLGGLQIKSDGVRLNNITVHESNVGVVVEDARNVVLYSVIVSAGLGNAPGITLRNAIGCTLAFCQSYLNGGVGILLAEGSSDNELGPGNVSIQNGGAGLILMEGSQRNVVYQSQIASNGGSGMGVFTDAHDNQIGPGNQVTGNGGAGMNLHTTDNVVVDNFVDAHTTFGIQLVGADRTLVDGNVVTDTEFACLYVKQSDECQLRNNQIGGSRTNFGVTLEDSPGAHYGPANMSTLNKKGGMLLISSDPCTIEGDNETSLNFGTGILIQTFRDPAVQQPIVIDGLTSVMNATGLHLADDVSSVVVRGCDLSDNVGSGLAITNDNTDFRQTGHLIQNNRIVDNGTFGLSSYWSGGYQFNRNLVSGHEGPGLTIQQYAESITIFGNDIRENGTGIRLIRADGASIVANDISENDGIGIALSGAATVVVNNMLWRNEYAAIQGSLDNNRLNLVNNTMVANGAGIDSGGYIRNCIVWNNRSGDVLHHDGLDLDHCLIGQYLCGEPSGGNNVFEDPGFEDEELGDLHLTAGSPALDRGDNIARWLPGSDYDGEARIQDGVVDIGADEFVSGARPERESDLPTPKMRLGGPTVSAAQSLIARHPVMAGLYDLLRDEHRGQGTPEYVVDNLEESGPGSLKEAMDAANTDLGPSLITFEEGLQGTILSSETLPSFADLFGPTTLLGPLMGDGETPAIRYQLRDGTRKTAMVLRTSGNTIRNLIIDASFDSVSLHGRAHDNTFENFHVLDSDNGLGIGIVGADRNRFINCRSGGHFDAGFSVVFGANDNQFIDCETFDNQNAIGLSFIACRGNVFKATEATKPARIFGNRWGVAINNGALENVIGPHVTIEDCGLSGIFIAGMGSDRNDVSFTQISGTQGIGFSINGWAEATRAEAVLVADTATSCVDIRGGPLTEVTGCFVDGRDLVNKAAIVIDSCSDATRISGGTVLTGPGGTTGIQVNRAAGVIVKFVDIQGELQPWGSGIVFENGADRCVAFANTIGSVLGIGPDRGVFVQDARDCVIYANTIAFGNDNGNEVDTGIQIGRNVQGCRIGPTNGLVASSLEAKFAVLVGESQQPPTEIEVIENRIVGQGVGFNGIHGILAGQNLRVDSNWVQGFRDAGILIGSAQGVRVTNNLVENCTDGIRLLWNSGLTPLIAFNTVVANDLGISGEGIILGNNLWENVDDHLLTRLDTVHCNNVQDLSGLPNDNISVDPRFRAWYGRGDSRNDFHLRFDSPLIDRACLFQYSILLSRDFDGDSRPRGAAMDLGFDEF